MSLDAVTGSYKRLQARRMPPGSGSRDRDQFKLSGIGPGARTLLPWTYDRVPMLLEPGPGRLLWLALTMCSERHDVTSSRLEYCRNYKRTRIQPSDPSAVSGKGERARTARCSPEPTPYCARVHRPLRGSRDRPDGQHDSFRLDAAVRPDWTGYTFDAGRPPTRSDEEVPWTVSCLRMRALILRLRGFARR